MASITVERLIEIVKYALIDIEDPVNIVPIALILVCLLFGGRPSGCLPLWAMFNGCLIHCWMDGYHSLVQRRWYSDVVAIIVSVFQLMGTILYLGGEVMDNFVHLPSSWPPSFSDPKDLFYFWFIFVFCNCVWILIPITVISRSFWNISTLYYRQAKPLKKKEKKSAKQD